MFNDDSNFLPYSGSFEQMACREFAENLGKENQDVAWILTNFDTWERNPFYVGTPVPHPEEDYYDEEELDTISESQIQEDFKVSPKLAEVYYNVELDEVFF